MPEFACADCNAQFNTLDSLEAHEYRSHTGDKPIRRGGPDDTRR